ncbi:hypothetical protein KO465_06400 [Candidatus Micrarchaeota archaeon]|nr:hypothetical protein [Candidatus Micrarchaeota archaeon]
MDSKEIEENKVKEILDKRFVDKDNSKQTMLLLGGAVFGIVLLLFIGALLSSGTFIKDVMNFIGAVNDAKIEDSVFIALTQSEELGNGQTNGEVALQEPSIPNTPTTQKDEEPKYGPPSTSGEDNIIVLQSTGSSYSSGGGSTTKKTTNNKIIIHELNIDSNNGYINNNLITINYDVSNVKTIVITEIRDLVKKTYDIDCENKRCDGTLQPRIIGRDGQKQVTISLENGSGDKQTKTFELVLDTISPDGVNDITATQIGIDNKVKIEWGISNERVTYILYRLDYTKSLSRPNPGENNEGYNDPQILSTQNMIRLTEGENTGYIDEDLEYGKTYSYFVRAVDKAGNPSLLSPAARVIVRHGDVIDPNPQGPPETPSPVANNPPPAY